MRYGRRFYRPTTRSPALAVILLRLILGKHRLRTTHRAGSPSLRLRVVHSRGVTSVILRADRPLRIDGRWLRRDYLMLKVLTGICSVKCGRERIVLDAGRLVMIAPDQPFVLRVESGTALRLIRIDRDMLHQKCARLTGVLPASPIWFRLVEGTTMPASELEAWSQSLERFLAWLEDEEQRWPQGFWRAAEEAFIERLLRYPGHDYDDRVLRRELAYTVNVPARALAGAEFVAAWIRTYPLQKGSLAFFTRLAALSSRRELARAFRWLFRVSIRKFRLQIRLNCVHLDLLNVEPGSGVVSSVARRWAFRRGPYFYWQYCHRFGEWPDETLRRRPE
ncbi:AraC-like ligand-binding domain-containing protein [Amycolatopsis alkalitolerans]|uniref:AraC family transcriptional regulator n=1 Tax=Amycolatopsis alkalitolerans TaxID=2547244 RepID=A0A5C4LTA1_9PSEU|nr:helix-turn-helix domain-containing protein [Amycolatopsis alkalitolerans]TNC22247.1 AraC family transcriptional regulator [Amycolatopsis alkalitolerans]